LFTSSWARIFMLSWFIKVYCSSIFRLFSLHFCVNCIEDN
jgi:hypothetical protein